MGVGFRDYNYSKFAPHVDVISWDSYPYWHSEENDLGVARETAFTHDFIRGLKLGHPFLLMETTPSQTNWQPVSRPRRPGVNRLNGLQAVAHGADSVCYFQFRKGRGGTEKFHGAVVDHAGHETRGCSGRWRNWGRNGGAGECGGVDGEGGGGGDL